MKPYSRVANPNPLPSTVSKMQILNELNKTIEGINSGYGGIGGRVTDIEMQQAIACHRAAMRVISSMPASSFPLGKRKKGEWH